MPVCVFRCAYCGITRRTYSSISDMELWNAVLLHLNGRQSSFTPSLITFSVWTTICPLFFVFTSKWHQHQTVNNLAQRCPYIYCTFPQKQSRYDMYFNFLWKITVVVCAEKCPGIMFCNYCHKYYLLLLKLLPRTEKLMVNYDIYIIAFRKHFVTGARGTFLWQI